MSRLTRQKIQAITIILSGVLVVGALVAGPDGVGAASRPLAAQAATGADLSLLDSNGLDKGRTDLFLHSPAAGPGIGNVTTNLGDYLNSQVPKYEKLELTFDVVTIAQNPQLPYDDNPPPGIEPGIGISVDALFTANDWQTAYTQPAFYYEEFDHQIKSGKDWLYPTGNFVWKVRFSPTQEGDWQFRLRAQDASGIFETPGQSFSVVPSDNKGFVRVSQNDTRYFEFENGETFLGLGYNLVFNGIDWDNPTVVNEPRFQEFQQDGLTFFRFWLSQWGIFTSAWNAWNSPLPSLHAQYIPYANLSFDYAYPGSEVSMGLYWPSSPSMFLGFMKQAPAVKRNTVYHLSIRYLIPEGLQGPRIQGNPYGFVAKVSGWLGESASEPGTGTPVTDYVVESPNDGDGTPQWAWLEGEIQVGERDFLPYLYLALENVGGGAGGVEAYIDRVEVREDLGDGQYGPNIVSQPWMAHHLYMDQRNSFALDLVLDLAEEYDIYLKPVILEKNEWLLNHIDYSGEFVGHPSNNNFYGDWREVTKVRWLQQAWWRYLQARWGYSTNIQSWELLNEGDPWNGLHYTLADEFGAYMHQFAPNDHLVSTSFWHSFPRDAFWANPAYPNIDFADIHKYEEPTDTALSTQSLGEQYGALQPGGANKPLIRGETGFGSGVLQDTEGIWLHNYIWGLINPSGMYEHYWYSNEHIVQPATGNDLRYHYEAYHDFMADIPLNNGNYQDVQAVVTNENIRVWGQKDTVNGRAHIWIQNKNHTWTNVVDGVTILPVSGNVSIQGLSEGTYIIEWWDIYTGTITAQDHYIVGDDGTLTFAVQSLDRDVGIKVSPYTPDSVYLPLAEGWNLISLPFMPDDPTPVEVFSDIQGQYGLVETWEGGEWKVYAPGQLSYNQSLHSISVQRGYWLYLNQPTTITFAGPTPDISTIALSPGWNLVGYPRPIARLPSLAFASIAGCLQEALSYSADESGAWSHYVPGVTGDTFILRPGHGYWLHTNSACTWVLPE